MSDEGASDALIRVLFAGLQHLREQLVRVLAGTRIVSTRPPAVQAFHLRQMDSSKRSAEGDWCKPVQDEFEGKLDYAVLARAALRSCSAVTRHAQSRPWEHTE